MLRPSKLETQSSKDVPMEYILKSLYDQPYDSSSMKHLRNNKYSFVLTIASLVPSILFIHAFSAIGYGRENILSSRDYNKYSFYVLLGIVLFSWTVSLFDIYYWDSLIGKAFRDTSIAIIGMSLIAAVLLKQYENPTGPLCVYVVTLPIWLLGIKHFFFDQINIQNYIGWLRTPLLVSSVVIIVIWVYWVLCSDNSWDTNTKLEYSEALGCQPNFSSLPECINTTHFETTGEMETCFGIDKNNAESLQFDSDCNRYCIAVYGKCVHAFLLWANPILAGLAIFMLSFICGFFNHNTEPFDWKIMFVVKIYILLLFVMWCAASLAGAGEGLSRSFFAFALASFAAVGIFIYPITNASQFHKEQVRLKELFLQTYSSYLNIFRSLLVITCAPIGFIYLVWSVMNQCIRRLSFPCSKKVNNSFVFRNWRSFLTEEALDRLQEFNSWDHCKIYKYAIYWGLIHVLFEVIVKKFTVSFLSWLIYISENLMLPTATILIFMAGILLFLLPPVPGGPIYIAGGIVLLSSGRHLFGITGSIIYSCIISLITKLCACTIQQELIGGSMSKSVKIRQLVKINSRVIRAVKLLLSGKTLTIPKIAILVGGPDWPTSVLCGILDVDLMPALLGTIPIILIIIPMTLIGSFTYMANLPPVDGTIEFPWAGTACVLTVVVTSGLQFGSMALAAHFIEKTLVFRQMEVDSMIIDLQVLEADREAEAINNVYSKVETWSTLPSRMKWVLNLSLYTMIATCYIVSFLNSWCFEDIDFIQSNDTNDSYILGFIKPLGVAVLSLFCVSCILLLYYLYWVNKKTIEIMSFERAYANPYKPLNSITTETSNGSGFSDEKSPLHNGFHKNNSILYGTI